MMDSTSYFTIPEEEIAAEMPVETAMAQRHNLKKEYRRVSMKEYPKGYFTIQAFERLPDLRVINQPRRIAA